MTPGNPVDEIVSHIYSLDEKQISERVKKELEAHAVDKDALDKNMIDINAIELKVVE
jgi:hypothetical protein